MINISAFEGEAPKISAKLLPNNYATSAVNCDLQSGNLQPIKGVSSVQDVEPGAMTIFRLGEQWLQWNNKVNVVESLVYNSSNRVLFTGDFYPKETNFNLALSGYPFPDITRRLGIAAPTTAPLCSIIDAGVGENQEVSYCYTIIGRWEDGTVVESGPSLPTDNFTAKDDATIRVSDFVDATEPGVYTTHFRIYRINNGNNGAEYQFVADLDKLTDPLQYDDAVPDADLGEVLPTDGWTSPIDDLKGLITTPNGLAFGYDDNTVYVSESYISYAYPVVYAVPVGSEIVGLGFNGSSVVVFTKTKVCFIYGSTPESLSVDPKTLPLPCKSDRSIVSFTKGVIFAAPTGLYLIDSGGNEINLTKDIFTTAQWDALGPENIFAFYHEDAYVAFFEGTTQGIEFNPGSNTIRRFTMDEAVYGGQYVSTVSVNLYNLLTSDGENFLTSEGYQFVVTGGAYSIEYDTLYLIQTKGEGREIVSWKTDSLLDYEWASKELYYRSHQIFTSGLVVGDFTEGSVVLSLYIDGQLAFKKTVFKQEIFRISSPKRGNTFKIVLTGKATVDQVLIGASALEVAGKAYA